MDATSQDANQRADYDPASNVATVATPNQLTANFTYDALNRLTAMTTSVSSYTYTQGPTGIKTGVSEGNGRTISWNYDGIYRLTNETISNDPNQNNGSASYSLDPVGNRLSLNSSLPEINSGSFGYNADDEISSETYDANGNVLATGGKTYTYDSENHMISANNGQVRMIYDGDGNRVAKIVGGVTTQYLVDDLNPTGYAQVVEEVVNGAVTRQYTYGLQRISESQFINNVWSTSFYGYDGGGNVRQLTNSAGVVTDEYEYDAYGNSFTKQGTTPNNYLYRGEQYDSDLGLYYLRARYYNPMTGRFVSRDPEDGIDTDPATLHKYDYAGGDPVNAIDPTGRATMPLPVPQPRGAGAGMEYAMLLSIITIAEIPAIKAAACSLSTAYYYLADSIPAITSGGEPAIPEPEECKARCGPCDPPVGTECQQSDSGHLHHGWDPHYHLWKRGQRPDCTCTWNKINDKTRPDPISGGDGDLLPECSSFSSWSLSGGR
jgi:RHS repeat-associated protein